jgi:hypothetical protein
LKYFVVAIRTIFYSHCRTPEGDWDPAAPGESDERLLAYLHRFDYDGQRALLHALTDLGHGKGAADSCCLRLTSDI